jgi:hypothetical protein
MTSAFQSTTGGVMTVEAGAVTGDLELCTTLISDGVSVKVRYAGAAEWYAVEGSPAPFSAFPRRDHPAVHRRILRLLTIPGPVESGNETPVDLDRRSSP